MVGFTILALAAVTAAAGFKWWPLSAAAAVGLVAFDRWSTRGWLDPTSWLRGRRGERAVASALRELEPEGYRAVHDVPYRYGNIDHVVVGPTGVFAIETKHRAGRYYPAKGGQLRQGGFDRGRDLDQAMWGAQEVRQRLGAAGVETWVEAVLVSTNASVAGGRLAYRHVTVVDLEHLAPFIRGRRKRMSEADRSRSLEALATPAAAPKPRGLHAPIRV